MRGYGERIPSFAAWSLLCAGAASFGACSGTDGSGDGLAPVQVRDGGVTGGQGNGGAAGAPGTDASVLGSGGTSSGGAPGAPDAAASGGATADRDASHGSGGAASVDGATAPDLDAADARCKGLSDGTHCGPGDTRYFCEGETLIAEAPCAGACVDNRCGGGIGSTIGSNDAQRPACKSALLLCPDSVCFKSGILDPSCSAPLSCLSTCEDTLECWNNCERAFKEQPVARQLFDCMRPCTPRSCVPTQNPCP